MPGEAETSCAFHVLTHGGIALTGDSDMLVYDLNLHGAVAFFNQLETQNVTSCEMFRTALFRPSEITKGFGLENLQRLAFEIRQGSYLKVSAAVGLAHSPAGKPEALEEFLGEYEAPTGEFETTSLVENEGWLDPRLSELVLSASSLLGEDTLLMYLPFLIDDPSHSSAWLPSSHIRQLVYSLLPLIPSSQSQYRFSNI